MGGFDWQTGVALAIVAAVAVWLGSRALRLLAGKAGGSCGAGCGSCGANAKMEKHRGRDLPLVSLDASGDDGK